MADQFPKIGRAKYSLIGHLANQTSWLILCTGSVFQNCEQELHLMKLRSRFQLQVTMVSVDESSRNNAVVLVSPPSIVTVSLILASLTKFLFALLVYTLQQL